MYSSGMESEPITREEYHTYQIMTKELKNMIQEKRSTYSSSCLSIKPAPFKWNVTLEFTGFTVPFSLNGIGDLNTYLCVKLSSILVEVDEASISHFSVTDSAKSLGMPLNWDLMLSRPLAMETGSSGGKMRS